MQRVSPMQASYELLLYKKQNKRPNNIKDKTTKTIFSSSHPLFSKAPTTSTCASTQLGGISRWTLTIEPSLMPMMSLRRVILLESTNRILSKSSTWSVVLMLSQSHQQHHCSGQSLLPLRAHHPLWQALGEQWLASVHHGPRDSKSLQDLGI